ncbi:MAG: hypothetical protein AAGB22_10490, partial [Bacteroidota bacterium]
MKKYWLIPLFVLCCSWPALAQEAAEEEPEEAPCSLPPQNTEGGFSENLYPDGTLESEGRYNNGKAHGVWKFYYPNGK